MAKKKNIWQNAHQTRVFSLSFSSSVLLTHQKHSLSFEILTRVLSHSCLFPQHSLCIHHCASFWCVSKAESSFNKSQKETKKQKPERDERVGGRRERKLGAAYASDMLLMKRLNARTKKKEAKYPFKPPLEPFNNLKNTQSSSNSTRDDTVRFQERGSAPPAILPAASNLKSSNLMKESTYVFHSKVH